MTPENDHDDAATLHDLQEDFPHLDISIELLSTYRAWSARGRDGLTGARQPRALALSFGASLVAWALEVGVVMLTLHAIGLDLPVPAAFLVLAAVNLAIAFPVAPPANLGTLELGATLALLQFGVAKPQALAYRENMTLLDVMIAVGGITDFADGNKASILRTGGGKTQRFGVRLIDLVRGGDLSADVSMRPGDVLIIPQSFF